MDAQLDDGGFVIQGIILVDENKIRMGIGLLNVADRVVERITPDLSGEAVGILKYLGGLAAIQAREIGPNFLVTS